MLRVTTKYYYLKTGVSWYETRVRYAARSRNGKVEEPLSERKGRRIIGLGVLRVIERLLLLQSDFTARNGLARINSVSRGARTRRVRACTHAHVRKRSRALYFRRDGRISARRTSSHERDVVANNTNRILSGPVIARPREQRARNRVCFSDCATVLILRAVNAAGKRKTSPRKKRRPRELPSHRDCERGGRARRRTLLNDRVPLIQCNKAQLRSTRRRTLFPSLSLLRTYACICIYNFV